MRKGNFGKRPHIFCGRNVHLQWLSDSNSCVTEGKDVQPDSGGGEINETPLGKQPLLEKDLVVVFEGGEGVEYHRRWSEAVLKTEPP